MPMGLFNKLKETLGDQIGLDLPVNPFKTLNSVTQSQIPPQQPEPYQPPTPAPAAPAASAPTPGGGLYDDKMEQLIDMALADGELTEKEKQVLFKRAEAMGIDLDEFEMVLDARLYRVGQQQQPPQQTAATSAPKSEKYGDVKKCPACGAMIESFTAQCPECGYTFSNIAANSSIQKLFEMLNQVEAESMSQKQMNTPSSLGGIIGGVVLGSTNELFAENAKNARKKTIIQNFPVPTTKDDILEFLSLAVPLARKPKFSSGDRVTKIYEAWRDKCEQVIMKAKFAMREDKKTLEMIREYANELKIKM